ncbi:hypothetical protein PO909_004052 [Leuciscus waleckii]
MKFVCLTLLLVSGITDSRSEQYEVVGPADPVFAVAGEDVILPCSVKPNISVVDMRVEWFRLDLKDSLVHLYDDHEDRNTGQIQSYRGRTKLNHQELQRGKASLKLSTVQDSDEGRYKCLIQSKSWYDDATVDVRIEVIGSPPVITVDGFDRSGGFHLHCESEGWYPEPDLEWLDSEGVSLSSETTETIRNTDRFSVKHTVTVYDSNDKIHCRVKLRHHMLETLIKTTNNIFNFWRTSVILISVIVVLIVIAGILITVFTHKKRVSTELKRRQQYAVDVTLDPDTAQPNLILSDDGKQVRHGDIRQKLPDKPERFDPCPCVLGKEGFSSGRFYFEVQVKGKTKWTLGVARESINRKGSITLTPSNGCWTVGLRNENEYLACAGPSVSLCVRVKPQRVGVFVDYEEGLLSFYDVESSSHLYSFTDQSFTGKLYPYFNPCANDGGKNSTPLIITPVNYNK